MRLVWLWPWPFVAVLIRVPNEAVAFRPGQWDSKETLIKRPWQEDCSNAEVARK
jgi:hypothetical protein